MTRRDWWYAIIVGGFCVGCTIYFLLYPIPPTFGLPFELTR